MGKVLYWPKKLGVKVYLLNADSVFHASNMLISVVGLPGEKTGMVFLTPKSQGVSSVEMCVEAPLSFLKWSFGYSDETERVTFSTGHWFRTWNYVLLKYSVNENH